jgi:hypothetical protein
VKTRAKVKLSFKVKVKATTLWVAGGLSQWGVDTGKGLNDWLIKEKIMLVSNNCFFNHPLNK